MIELKLTNDEKKNILTALSYVIGELNKSANEMIEDEGVDVYRESDVPAHQVEFELLWHKVNKA